MLDEEKVHYEVSGVVTGQGGAPLHPARIVVWWQRIRDRHELATGDTDRHGRYHVRYRDPRPGGEPTLVVIEAISRELKTPLVSSPTAAQPTLQVDLALEAADKSVWTQLMGKIEPQLDRMKIVDLVEDAAHQDLTFLSMETGETTENLMQVVLAARLGAVNNLPAPLFFAFLRQQIPPDLPRPLLEASSQFTLIDALVKNVGSMIFAMPPDAQSSALLGAIALDLIDQQFTPEVERWVEGLQALRTTDLLDQPYSDTGSTLGELLKITQLSSARQQIFAKALASNTQSMSDFWSGLGGGNSGLTPDEAAGIQRVLSIGGFVQQYAPLVQSLNADFQSGRYTAMSQLATLSLQDWTALVGQTGTPANIEPAGDQSAADVFAASIYSQVTRTFPTTALSSRITQMEAFSEGDRQALTRFFDNNPKLELVSQNLPAYLEAQGGNVFAGINQEQQAAVIANTRALQRVLRVSSDTDAAHALLDLGLTSAAQISTLGKQQFATLAGARLNQEVIDRVFESAAHRYAGTVALYMRNNFDAIGPLPRMIMNRGELVPIASAAVQRDSSLSALFGSQDYCMVDDCTSILSPAAYLCDLLMWLRNHSQGDHTALEVLIGRRGLLFLGGLLINRPPIQLGGIPGRRPDIANLLLNCPNTNTELPYIDLVIELLADKISPPTNPNSALNPPWKQTSKTATAAQLRAAPEYFNQQAFVTLAGASYPQSLPYSTGLDELRTYLQQWNLPLWQLREALLPLDGAPESQRADVTAEQLGMNAYALQLTTTPDAIPAATAWGLPGASGSSLAPVPVFLAASGLAYDQLTALLGSRWVQGKQNIQIVGGDDTCDTGTMRLSPAPLSDWLDRAHRFIRLWRSTAYEMWELDLLLTAAAIGAGNLDAQALIQMHDFWKLQAKTKLKVDEQLAFYRPIDTSSHLNTKGQTIQPLYARLFLNPTTTWIAPDADMAGLANGAAPGDPVLANHAKAIQPAVGVSSDDLVTLFGLTDGQLSLDTLSLIWRIATLAKTANYSVTDLIAVAQLLDPGDLAVDALGKLLASPAATLAFLDQATALKSSPFGLDALTYLLTPPGADGSWATTSQMTDQDIAAALSNVGAAVAQLNATDEPSVEDKDKAIADAVVSAMAAGGASLAVDVTVRLLKLPDPTGTAPTLLDLLTDQATFLPIAITPQDDPNNPPPAPLTLNRTNCAAQFTAVQLFDKVALIVRALALGVDEIDWLLSNWSVYGGPDIANLPVTSGGASVQPLGPLLSMLDLVKLERGFPAAPAGSAYPTLLELIGAIASGDIADETTAQAALATVSRWPLADIQAFALALKLDFPGGSYLQPDAYDALRTLEVMSQSVQSSSAVPPASTTLATGIDGAQTQITVASAIGFPAPDFYVGIGAEILHVTAFGGADNEVWTVERDPHNAAPALAGAAVLTTYGARLVDWGLMPVDEIAAQSLAASALGALKAQQATEADWLKLAPDLMDPIRQRRSDALKAYLIAQRDATGKPIYGDTNGLFDYFLIDIEMSPCQVTSRVVQAYIAVQIFVERCFMNLETTLWNSSAAGVVVDPAKDSTWNDWEWMSRYRIWQANREVFCWPENWLIESERPSRTEIYRKFEQEVRQGTLTRDFLETTVLNYIDRLDGLAHLVVTGTCQDPATGSIYVVARSLSDPPVFYLRSCVDRVWSGWTEITVNIKAHQAIPALYRGRVCVFWMEVHVSKEPKQVTSSSTNSNTPPSQKVNLYVTLGMNFTVLRDGVWSPTQSARGKLFDKPIYDSTKQPTDVRSVEALYTIKAMPQKATSGYGAPLWIEVFRQGTFQAWGPEWEVAPDAPAEKLIQELIADGQVYFEKYGALPGHSGTVRYKLESVWHDSNLQAEHIGRAVFDGRFSDLELTNADVPYGEWPSTLITLLSGFKLDSAPAAQLLAHAKAAYGPDAQPLLLLTEAQAQSNLKSLEGGAGFVTFVPTAGALSAFPPSPNPLPHFGGQTASLYVDTGCQVNLPLPARVIIPSSDVNMILGLGHDFFVQDNRRAWHVETTVSVTLVGGVIPMTLGVSCHYYPFYHPFTRLLWNQLGAGGFDKLYDPLLQRVPDAIDPSQADTFSFKNTYSPGPNISWDRADAGTALAQPVAPGDSAIQVLENIWVAGHPGSVTIDGEEMLVTAVSSQDSAHWSVKRAQNGTAQASHAAGAVVTPTNLSQDRPFLDFSPGAAFSVYNWELFYHIPNYVAELLSQNLQFQDARDWFHYIFNPTKQGPSATPQRFWSTKPLHALSAKQMQSEEIATLLMDVNSGDKAAVDQVKQWRHDPFNPFALADVRPVAYMKSTVMSYLDNLIAWADNLFASQSREALSEATLIYVIAQEILGPAPTAIRPPAVADKSFAQLAPDLDAFANALVDIENAVRPGVVSGVAPVKPVHPVASHALYFKIPPNDKLLGYWSTVADRLYKLRHCQNISGEALQLALFDARIDPGMLIAARAAGVDLGSVLAGLNAPPPHYRFTALYAQALDFVNAVRDYGAALQSALEKVDASALALLQQTTQQQLLQDSAQILDWKVQQAQANLDALNETLNQAQAKHDFHSSQPFNNEWEQASVTMHNAANTAKGIAGGLHAAAAGLAAIPNLSLGTAGGFSSPVATGGTGGLSLSQAGDLAAKAADMVAQGLQIASDVSKKLGDWNQRKTESAQQAVEAQTQINHATNQIKAAEFALQIAQAQQDRHQERIDDIQKQIDFMTDKFTSKSLYDWMVGNLSATYFQSYRLAYQMCKQVEQCYHAELGEQDSFIQFSYWDSLHKGLLAGEGLSHDLRRLQAAYLAKNKRRFELSRHIPLSSLPGNPLGELKGINRKCSFDLKEDLFYPGHYNRRIVRVSVTIDYPNRGEFDNVKATLALNGHAIQTAPNEPVPNPLPAPATPQKIALSNAQDDPGLFVAGDIRHNLADPRYLPFENCGAISNWTLDMTQENNGVDPSTVNDVIIHLYYTALD